MAALWPAQLALGVRRRMGSWSTTSSMNAGRTRLKTCDLTFA
jgi:hypothetical protein